MTLIPYSPCSNSMIQSLKDLEITHIPLDFVVHILVIKGDETYKYEVKHLPEEIQRIRQLPKNTLAKQFKHIDFEKITVVMDLDLMEEEVDREIAAALGLWS